MIIIADFIGNWKVAVMDFTILTVFCCSDKAAALYSGGIRIGSLLGYWLY